MLPQWLARCLCWLREHARDMAVRRPNIWLSMRPSRIADSDKTRIT